MQQYFASQLLHLMQQHVIQQLPHLLHQHMAKESLHLTQQHLEESLISCNNILHIDFQLTMIAFPKSSSLTHSNLQP